ncbi:MAG TPA: hypothetical protein VGF80_08930 [Galbitalea sp.]|jgi:hypothetical protein
MNSQPVPSIIERYQTVLDALRALELDVVELRACEESTALRVNAMQAEAGRLLGAAGAVIAGDLAYRSRPALGGEGLARRTGHRTVENLLKSTTGATKEQATTAVRAGILLTELVDDGTVDVATGEFFTASQPWLEPAARAVADGVISTSALASIAAGLGIPNSAVATGDLRDAAQELVHQAVAGLDADRLWRAARDLRDELDLAGVKIREDEAHALRGFTHRPLVAGGGVATWRMDGETYALFVDAYDRMTSPKRGGVRFVEPKRAAQADRIRGDDRSPAQLASDGFMHLIQAGANVDDSVMLGSGAPVIRLTVAESALESGVGLARIDGQAVPVSLRTAERLACEGDIRKVGFDAQGHFTEQGHFIEHGSDARLYSRKQREILAAKFGGCMDPDCDRPPSWCEAHHILHWVRDRGKTLIVNGILLCKYHHLLYHNRGYEITCDREGRYWKIPPQSTDAEQKPIAMPLKTRNLRDLGLLAAVAV